MQQYVMNVEPKLIKEVDGIIKREKLYSSRNEFIRDAIRSKVMNCRVLKMRALAKDARENAERHGVKIRLPTRKERDKFAEEFLKEKGFSLH